MCENEKLAGHRNVANMLGYCNTTIVTEYHDSFLGIMFREGQPLPIAQIVSMALDAARGLQVGQAVVRTTLP